MNPKRLTLRHIIKMPKFKVTEIILKAAREKQIVAYKGAPRPEGLGRKYQSNEKPVLTTKIILPSKTII